MKSLVIGYGSIGRRHARVLKELGCDVALVSRRKLSEPFPVFASIAKAVKGWLPEYVVVANETSAHAESLRVLDLSGFKGAVLVEKPLYDTPQKLGRFDFKSVAVGYNLRFHPALVRLKTLLKKEKIISAQVYAGGYLPNWRPGDYRKCYSAKKNQGGGVLRDLSHELDVIGWVFGSCKRVAAIGGHFSALKIDSDDAFGMLMETSRCPLVTVQINYLDRPGRREILVNTDRHTFKADLVKGMVSIDGKEEGYAAERDFTYREQHRAVILKKNDNLCFVKDALEVVRVVDAVEKAARQKKWVKL